MGGAILQVDVQDQPRRRLVDLTRRRSFRDAVMVYEATSDEDEEAQTITAKKINQDGTLVGADITFYTLAPRED